LTATGTFRHSAAFFSDRGEGARSLFDQGTFWCGALPNRKEEKALLLTTAFDHVVREHGAHVTLARPVERESKQPALSGRALRAVSPGSARSDAQVIQS
jgi:hypothetical protein